MTTSLRCLLVVVALILVLPLRSIVSQQALERPSEDEQNQTTEEEQPRKKAGKTEEAPERSSKVLQDTMTAKEFKAAGLEKLSSEELANLNRWLQGYRETSETKAAEKAAAKATAVATEHAAKMVKHEQVLSRVDGTFTGLTGATIITLEDGTKWKQANASDHYRAQITDHPPVAVMHGAFGFKMRIVGTPEFYVDPVRK